MGGGWRRSEVGGKAIERRKEKKRGSSERQMKQPNWQAGRCYFMLCWGLLKAEGRPDGDEKSSSNGRPMHPTPEDMPHVRTLDQGRRPTRIAADGADGADGAFGPKVIGDATLASSRQPRVASLAARQAHWGSVPAVDDDSFSAARRLASRRTDLTLPVSAIRWFVDGGGIGVVSCCCLSVASDLALAERAGRWVLGAGELGCWGAGVAASPPPSLSSPTGVGRGEAGRGKAST